jgi:hypothetical protein
MISHHIIPSRSTAAKFVVGCGEIHHRLSKHCTYQTRETQNIYGRNGGFDFDGGKKAREE